MIKKAALAVALLLLSAVAVAQQEKHSVWGSVTDRRTGETLVGATVFDTLSRQGVSTNQHGRFSLPLKPGRAVVRVSFVGYEPQFFDLDIVGDHRLEVALEDNNTLSVVHVVGQRESQVESSQLSRIDVPVEQIRSVPVFFGETDVVKVMQLLPGVQSGNEGMAGMYVRGGGPDQNLYLLDGVPMYNVNHLGGFFSAFNADAIKSVQLYKGSFPAHFGSRLSSVLDITTNNGNDKEFHGGIEIGPIAGRVSFEGPIVKEKTTFSVSARRTFYDLLLQPVLGLVSIADGLNEKYSAGYYFYDLNAKVTHKFNDRSRLYASFYAGDDAIYAKLKSYESSMLTEYIKLNYDWGNLVGSLRWNRELSPRLSMNLTGAYTRYRNKMKLSEEVNIKDYLQSVEASYNSGIQDWSARADFDWHPVADHAVKFGGQFTHHIFTPEVTTAKMDEKQGADYFSFDTVIGQSRIRAEELSAFIEDDWRISSKVKVNGGLNLTGFAVQDKFYPSVQPRLSGRWLITDRLSFKTGYACMTQYLHLLSNSSISLPTDLWVPVTARISPMTAHQVAAGLFYDLLDLVDLSVEGYYKRMNNLLEYKDGASFWGASQGWENKVCMGRGWSYGVELMAQKRVGAFTGWLAYTWSRSDRLFDREGMTLNRGLVFPAKYDRRHDVSIVLSYKFSEKFDMAATWVFSTGNAATLALQDFSSGIEDTEGMLPYVSSRNNYRMPNYHRLDVGFNWHRKLKHGRRTINLSVYNAYNHKNPYLIYESYSSLGNSSLVQLSLFPIMPSLSYLWKF